MESKDSCPADSYCSKAELDLFNKPPVNISMERGVFQHHFPVATIAPGAPIEFHVQASPEEYIDLGRTTLQLQLAVRQRVGNAPLHANQRVAPVQNIMHSLFQQIDVKLNDRLVTPSLNTYPYKAYLETLCSHGFESKKTWLSAEGWFGEAGDNPAQLWNPAAAAGAAPGVRARGNLIANGHDFELEGRPHVDIFQQERYLVPGVSMHVKFQLTPAAFHLMYNPATVVAGNAQGHFTTIVRQAVLKIRKVRCNPDLLVEHARLMDAGSNALYPLRRGIVTTFTVAGGGQSFVQENLISGQLPRRALVALVSNAAFNGTTNINPFNFQHFGLNFLSASIGTETFPSQPFKPNYPAELYTQVYVDFMRVTGSLNASRGIGINYEDFLDGGHVIYAFDFTPDMADGGHVDRIKYGSLRLEGQFANPLPNAVNVIVFSEYDNLLQVDRARNVITDFASL